MGTSDFGIPTLRALGKHHDVAAVVTRPDSLRGRGLKQSPSAIKTAALEAGIPVFDPPALRDEAFLSELRGIGAELFFVAAFRILPPSVFTMPPLGTVNLHGSLLPDYRGAAPVQRAVINGDTETGLTTFFIAETVDTGDIILTERVPIGPEETSGELFARMREIGASLALRTVDLIASGNPPHIPQPTSPGRPAPKLRKEEGLIDWSRDIRSIHDQVRGMNPEPGAFIRREKGILKIHRTRILDEDSSGVPGTVAESSPQEGFSVWCGRGSLAILEVQPEGKRPMDSAAYVRGYLIEKGMCLGIDPPPRLG
jgi:methionyl-tRNA formyltransferase